MANSKRAVLLAYLKSTIFPVITVANGYNNNIGLIDRGLRSIETLSDDQFPALFIASADEQRKNITKIHFESQMTVHLVGYVKDAGAPGGSQALLDDFIEDVTKALYQNPLQDGSALFTRIRSVNTDSGDLKPHAGFVMQADLEYASQGTAP